MVVVTFDSLQQCFIENQQSLQSHRVLGWVGLGWVEVTLGEQKIRLDWVKYLEV